MSETTTRTPIDFCDELLEWIGRDFIESGKYKDWGISYPDAMAQVWQWNGGAKYNLEFIKEIHSVIGIAIGYLEKQNQKGGEK